MSLDQVPAQNIETNDGSKYANLGGQLQSDKAQTGMAKGDNAGNSTALVNSGVLPDVQLHGHDKLVQENRVANGDGGQLNKERTGNWENHGERPGEHHRGEHGRGRHHERPEEKLKHAEIKSLSPEEKAKFKSEDGAAHKYHAEMAAWKRSGKTGPEPTKPDIPEHDKVAAKVKEDRKAIEEKVRESMPAKDLSAYDNAKTEYKTAVAQAGGRKGVPVPEELKDFHKELGKATREFVEGKTKTAS